MPHVHTIHTPTAVPTHPIQHPRTQEYNAATPGYKEWSAPKAGGWVTVGPWDKPGTYWYSCPVTGHCAAGMKVRRVVGGRAGGWVGR